MKKILFINLMALFSFAGFGFTPPSGNTTVMVNNSNVLVSPTATQLIDANPELSDYFKINGWQINIDTTPSVNPIDGYQTQYKTLEINTPNIDLTDLLQGKQSRGELWFDNGIISRSGNFPLTAPFSICFTYDVPQGAWDNIVYGSAAINFFNTYTYSTNGSTFSPRGVRFAYDQSAPNGYKRLIVAFGQPATSSEVRNAGFYVLNNVNLPLGKHTLCLIVRSFIGNGVNVAYSIDGGALITIPAGSMYGSITSESVGTVGGFSAGNKGSYWGENLSGTTKSVFAGTLSNYRVFNFDMSDTNAPYTVADYQNGVDVPPSLRGGTANVYRPDATTASDYTLKASHLTEANAFASVDNSTNTISIGVNAATTIQKADEVWIRAYYPFPIKPGDKIEIKCASAYRNPSVYSSSMTGNLGIWTIRSHTTNTTATATTVQVLATPKWNDTDFEQTTIATAAANYISLAPSWTSSIIPVGSDIPANTVLYSFTGLEIRVNGALLDLENYTFNDGNGQKIYDISGNGNDASITGNVAGTNDAAVAALYKAFTGNNATLSGSGYPPTGGSVIETLRAALNPDGTTYTTLYQYEDDIVVPTDWTDSEFKVLDSDGNLIYWVSTQWGAQMGTDYTTNPASDLNAKIFYTSPENEANGTGKGREWIEYVHNDVSARTIYEHAQGITGSPTPTIGGIIIQPNFSGTTVGGTSIQSIFGKNVLDAPTGNQFIYLKASPTNLEKTKTAYPIWRTIRPIPVQGGN